jgi:hypothetical protein
MMLRVELIEPRELTHERLRFDRLEIRSPPRRPAPGTFVRRLAADSLRRLGSQQLPPHHRRSRPLEQIKAGYREIQQQESDKLDRVIGAFDREADRFEKVIQVIEPLLENGPLHRENHDLLVRISQEIKTLTASPEN